MSRVKTLTLKRARSLRRALTPPEVRLWARLRRRLDDQPVFRRQHPCGPYILDFFCPEARLVIEVDGWGHNMGDQPEHDLRRDAWLRSQGLEVLRLRAADVFSDADAAADLVRRTTLGRIGGRK